MRIFKASALALLVYSANSVANEIQAAEQFRTQVAKCAQAAQLCANFIKLDSEVLRTQLLTALANAEAQANHVRQMLATDNSNVEIAQSLAVKHPNRAAAYQNLASIIRQQIPAVKFKLSTSADVEEYVRTLSGLRESLTDKDNMSAFAIASKIRSLPSVTVNFEAPRSHENRPYDLTKPSFVEQVWLFGLVNTDGCPRLPQIPLNFSLIEKVIGGSNVSPLKIGCWESGLFNGKMRVIALPEKKELQIVYSTSSYSCRSGIPSISSTCRSYAVPKSSETLEAMYQAVGWQR